MSEQEQWDNCDGWFRWLSEREFKAFKCRHLLPAPAPEIIEQWAKQLCDDRERLAIARGVLFDVAFGLEYDIEEALEQTKPHYRYIGAKDER